DELSVGEQRRVALAGLLAAQPRLLVLDEPLAWLDQAGRAALPRALRPARDAGVTLVLTAHETDGLADLVDAAVEVVDGRLRPAQPRAVRSLPRPESAVGAADAPGAARVPQRRAAGSGRGRQRAAPPAAVLRTLPGSSPAHRLWAGTKIGVLACVVLALAARPTWPALAAAAVVL